MIFLSVDTVYRGRRKIEGKEELGWKGEGEGIGEKWRIDKNVGLVMKCSETVGMVKTYKFFSVSLHKSSFVSVQFSNKYQQLFESLKLKKKKKSQFFSTYSKILNAVNLKFFPCYY